MKTFEEVKQEIIKTAKNNNACNEGINDALNSKSFPELLDVIVKYISWLCNTRTITGEWLENNFSELLESRNIYVRGFHSVSNKICYAFGNSTVNAWDNSTVNAWDNSTVEALSNSTVEAWGNSYCEFFNSKENHSVNESAILKDYYNKTIYIKKDNFKIIKL